MLNPLNIHRSYQQVPQRDQTGVPPLKHRSTPNSDYNPRSGNTKLILYWNIHQLGPTKVGVYFVIGTGDKLNLLPDVSGIFKFVHKK